MIFAHRLNTIQHVYENYYKNTSSAFEIDIQMTKDLKLVVYHDDVSSKSYSELPNTTPLFEDFLKYIPEKMPENMPENMTINVEIKKYKNSIVALEYILSIIEKYKHTYIFSSFDKEIYNDLISLGKDAWHLVKETDKYSQDTPYICIHKDLIPYIIPDKHKRICVYGFKKDEIDSQLSFITDWIVDF